MLPSLRAPLWSPGLLLPSLLASSLWPPGVRLPPLRFPLSLGLLAGVATAERLQAGIWSWLGAARTAIRAARATPSDDRRRDPCLGEQLPAERPSYAPSRVDPGGGAGGCGYPYQVGTRQVGQTRCRGGSARAAGCGGRAEQPAGRPAGWMRDRGRSGGVNADG